MNVDFESDRTAFEQLIRGRDLAELFSDRILADRIFEAALAAKADVGHISISVLYSNLTTLAEIYCELCVLLKRP